MSKLALVLTLLVRVCPSPALAVTSTSKAGLAWPNSIGEDITQYTTTGKVSWYYTWSPDPIDSTPGDAHGLEFVPMLWGDKSTADFQQTINTTITRNSVKAVLGMNEPQQTGQSNLSPDAGAQLWKTYLEPLKAQGIRLGSPAPSSAPSGKTWLQQFFTSCGGGCTVDFIALHWYDINATQFQEYLQDFHNTFNLPIWVTEWACQNFNDPNAQCSAADVVTFLNQTQIFMDSAEWIERYSWFGAFKDLQGVNPLDALMNTQGKITPLGQQYIGEHPADPNTVGNGGNGPSVSFGGSQRTYRFDERLRWLFSAVLLSLSLRLL